MRNIIKIADAVLIMAAAMPMRAQEWTKLNDTTYVRHFMQTKGVVTEYAHTLDMVTWNTKLNNDMRGAALCQAGAMGCGVAAGVTGLLSALGNNRATGLTVTSLVFLAAGVGFGVASIVKLHQNKVYITPDGVAIRISRTERSYQNKPDNCG